MDPDPTAPCDHAGHGSYCCKFRQINVGQNLNFTTFIQHFNCAVLYLICLLL